MPCSTSLKNPVRGLNSITQPIASSMGGVAIGRMIITRTSPRAGRSVRSTSQAMMMPIDSAPSIEPTANWKVVQASL